ncbi:MAG: hypothetical protein L6Q83_13740 [Gammaproteobacteria bacterium]|jgi:hypothetical protein|nr:hypothetical protein [Gammaproteobacteria bacterium]
MTTGTIFYFAVGVFLLMFIGLVLTMLEYRRLNESERRQPAARSSGRATVSEHRAPS